jgi:hypothetical protein
LSHRIAYAQRGIHNPGCEFPRRSSRTTTLFDAGVFDTFATESSGTRTFVSGKYAAAQPRAVA